MGALEGMECYNVARVDAVEAVDCSVEAKEADERDGDEQIKLGNNNENKELSLVLLFILPPLH